MGAGLYMNKCKNADNLLEDARKVCYNYPIVNLKNLPCAKRGEEGERLMAKHIQVVVKGKLQETAKNGGCGSCQSSCQSACKTSCTVGNQACEK